MDISIGVMLSKKYTNLYIYGLSEENSKIVSNRNTTEHIASLSLSKLYPPVKSEEINIILATQFAIDMGLGITEDPDCGHRVVRYSLQDIQKWVNNATKNIKIAVRAIRPGEVLTLYPSDDLECVNFDIQANNTFYGSAIDRLGPKLVNKVPVCFILVAREQYGE